MRKRHSDVSYLLFIISIILALGCFNVAWGATPEIYSITPDIGRNDAPTQVTIKGSGFQPTPKVALYGGGLYKIDSCNEYQPDF